MENASIEPTHGVGSADPLLQRVTQQIKSSSPDAGQPSRLKVDVKRSGKWFILEGSVSSYRMKIELFSWVPRIHGAQHIVDKLRVHDVCGVEG
jgi:hypothetical protein